MSLLARISLQIREPIFFETYSDISSGIRFFLPPGRRSHLASLKRSTRERFERSLRLNCEGVFRYYHRNKGIHLAGAALALDKPLQDFDFSHVNKIRISPHEVQHSIQERRDLRGIPMLWTKGKHHTFGLHNG